MGTIATINASKNSEEDEGQNSGHLISQAKPFGRVRPACDG